ncbi:MAG: hypothetical protein J6X18_00640 [Bacteroidales bacterium]|nr:hypothetical protein [Bacteroidales bacterium]
MPKHFNGKSFTFKDNKGNEHQVYCYMTRTRLYTTEHAECDYYDAEHDKCGFAEGKYKWSNRPWQSFTYCEAMKEMIKKLPKEWRENATRRLINDEDERITKECDAFVNAFKTNYDKLSDETKSMLAENAPFIETEEQANSMSAMVGMMALLGL